MIFNEKHTRVYQLPEEIIKNRETLKSVMNYLALQLLKRSGGIFIYLILLIMIDGSSLLVNSIKGIPTIKNKRHNK